jgi:hypothetical protein
MHPVGLVGLARADDYDQVRQICEMYSVSAADAFKLQLGVPGLQAVVRHV